MKVQGGKWLLERHYKQEYLGQLIEFSVRNEKVYWDGSQIKVQPKELLDSLDENGFKLMGENWFGDAEMIKSL